MKLTYLADEVKFIILHKVHLSSRFASQISASKPKDKEFQRVPKACNFSSNGLKLKLRQDETLVPIG